MTRGIILAGGSGTRLYPPVSANARAIRADARVSDPRSIVYPPLLAARRRRSRRQALTRTIPSAAIERGKARRQLMTEAPKLRCRSVRSR